MSSADLIVSASSILSVALGVYCNVPYFRTILNGKTRPHQLTWVVFAIMNGTVALSQFMEGARPSVLLPLTFFIANLVTIGLSFKYGVRDTSRYDKALFIGALLTIVAWIVTKDNVIAIWLTVLVDTFATAMTVLKIRNLPDSEDPLAWIIATGAYVFSCLSLLTTHFGILYVRPVYGLLSDVAIITAVYYYRINSSSKRQR